MTSYPQSRRRFLANLGLAGAARLLTPLAATLHGAAYGQAPARPRRLVVVSMAAGLPDLQLGAPSRTSETDWSYHEALSPLAPWRERTAIVSGLHLFIPGAMHTAGYGLLSGAPTLGGAETYGAPTAPTIDQLMAARLDPGAAFPSVLFGIDRDARRLVHTSLFASAASEPVPYPVQSRMLFERLFPHAQGAVASTQRTRLVLDRLRGDLRRLHTQLAPEEQRRLEQYEASIDAYDRRRASSTTVPERSPSGARGVVAELPEMFDMATLALKLGLTRVVGCAVGGGNSHWHFPTFVGPHVGTIFESRGHIDHHGHDGDELYFTGRTVTWRWLSERVAEFLTALSEPAADGRRPIDDTVLVLTSDAGPDHHNGNSYRFVVIAGEATGLRTGGRFVVYPPDSWGQPVAVQGSHTVNSFWRTVAEGLGAPLASFGQLRAGRSDELLPELLA